MFEEAEFDDEMGEMEANTLSLPREANATPVVLSPVKRNAFVHFHRPGEEGFSVVAGACDDADGRHDSHFISGDAWLSKECHCIQCETLRVMSRLNELQQARGVSPVIVLLDLDNFGYNQFKSIPPFADVELLDNVVVWAFFGSCLARYHKAWPTAQSVCEPLPGRAPTAAGSIKKSIWEIVVERRQVFFTPCGGHDQAADNVMQRVIHALHGVDTILLTADVKLIHEIYRARRLRGMKSKRHHEEDVTDRLALINVADLDKRFVPVWRALCRQIRLNLREEGGSTSDNSDEGRLRR